jgi:tRNA pseudouridine38/39 synthase
MDPNAMLGGHKSCVKKYGLGLRRGRGIGVESTRLDRNFGHQRHEGFASTHPLFFSSHLASELEESQIASTKAFPVRIRLIGGHAELPSSIHHGRQWPARLQLLEQRGACRTRLRARKAIESQEPSGWWKVCYPLSRRRMDSANRVSSTKPLRADQNEPPVPKKRRTNKPFDSSKYATRYIALKFAYLGGRYNGYEGHANNATPLPTIEETLWRALMKTRLIFPTPAHDRHGRPLGEHEVNWEGCEYSKCGRTDKGVSAFGQVIGLRVRSNRPLPRPPKDDEAMQVDQGQDTAGASGEQKVEEKKPQKEWDSVTDELQYPQILNGVLPPDIRITAWCPDPPPEFSARFSCRGRQYRYFFTQPSFLPSPGSGGVYRDVDGRLRREGWLDIEKMREAAQLLVGEHDFRNFCKIEPSKQITSFHRRIFSATVEEMDTLNCPTAPGQDFLRDDNVLAGQTSPHIPGQSKLYYFKIFGSAFLWHQVRNLVAILFLVGQGLERPSIVSDLLDVSKYPSRPHYNMADDAPLVLWDCKFPAPDADPMTAEDHLDWIYSGDARLPISETIMAQGLSDGRYGRKSLMEDMWTMWRQRKLDEVLAASLMDVVAGHPGGRDYPKEMKDEDVYPDR